MFIREGFEDGKSEQGQLDALIHLPFLAIDEADKSKRTDNEMNWLVLHHRRAARAIPAYDPDSERASPGDAYRVKV